MKGAQDFYHVATLPEKAGVRSAGWTGETGLDFIEGRRHASLYQGAPRRLPSG